MAKLIVFLTVFLFVLCQISISSQDPVRSKRQIQFPTDEETRFGGRRPQIPGGQNRPGQGRPNQNNQNRPNQNNQNNQNRPNQNNQNRPTQPTTTTQRTTTAAGQQQQSTANPVCEQNCLKTPEYNPVCGTNLVTYTNRGRLECARRCGLPNLQFMRLGNCPQPAAPEENMPISTLSPNQNFELCLSQCYTTAEYNPVCGTNFVTYQNAGSLACARDCGIRDLNILRTGPCPMI